MLPIFLATIAVAVQAEPTTLNNCTRPPYWILDGRDLMEEVHGHVTMVYLMQFDCPRNEPCNDQIHGLQSLVKMVDKHKVKYPDTKYIVIAAPRDRPAVINYWKGRLTALGIEVLQDTRENVIWKVLGGNAYDLFMYDTCGRQTFYVPYPQSSFRFHYAISVMHNTHISQTCGPCPRHRLSRRLTSEFQAPTQSPGTSRTTLSYEKKKEKIEVFFANFGAKVHSGNRGGSQSSIEVVSKRPTSSTEKHPGPTAGGSSKGDETFTFRPTTDTESSKVDSEEDTATVGSWLWKYTTASDFIEPSPETPATPTPEPEDLETTTTSDDRRTSEADVETTPSIDEGSEEVKWQTVQPEEGGFWETVTDSAETMPEEKEVKKSNTETTTNEASDGADATSNSVDKTTEGGDEVDKVAEVDAEDKHEVWKEVITTEKKPEEEKSTNPPTPKPTLAPTDSICSRPGLDCKDFPDERCYEIQKSGEELPECCCKGVYITDLCRPGRCTAKHYQLCCFQQFQQARYRCCQDESVTCDRPDRFSQCCHKLFTEPDICCPKPISTPHWAVESRLVEYCLPNVELDWGSSKIKYQNPDDENDYQVIELSKVEGMKYKCQNAERHPDCKHYLYIPDGTS